MNRDASDGQLDLGPDVIEFLIPHRAPLLLVSRIDAYHSGERPSIEASHFVSANEDVFRGHFPGFHVWPGVYTQEGLGQASQLLSLVDGLYNGWADAGEDPGGALDALRNLELGFSLHPGYSKDRSAVLIENLPVVRRHIGMAAAVDLKFVAPVLAGCRLDYRSTVVFSHDQMIRYEVEARVAGKTVVSGTITSSHRHAFPGP
jgi:3-hydroxyacyl-[acyl-carrier-protein] dehydratase